jgi:hypothetical protein
VEEAGFQTASALLESLLAQGCVLAEGWTDRNGAKVATVRGAIPASWLRAQALAPARRIPGINALEIQPDHIRVAGLAFEEYLIRTPGE